VQCVLSGRIRGLSVQLVRSGRFSGLLLIRGFGVQVPGGAPVLTCEYDQFLVSLGARNVGVGAPWVLVSQNLVGNGSECLVPMPLRCVTSTRYSAGTRWTTQQVQARAQQRPPCGPEGLARRAVIATGCRLRTSSESQTPCAAERSESVPGPDEVPAMHCRAPAGVPTSSDSKSPATARRTRRARSGIPRSGRGVSWPGGRY
jgi:hypothetical protein